MTIRNEHSPRVLLVQQRPDRIKNLDTVLALFGADDLNVDIENSDNRKSIK